MERFGLDCNFWHWKHTRSNLAGVNTPSSLTGRCVAGVFVLAVLAAIFVLRFHHGVDPVAFRPIAPTTFLGLIGWLTAVALFVERAVEVVVCFTRDQEADLIQEKIDAATAANAVLPTDQTKAALAAAVHAQTVYTANTKEFALTVSFAFSLLVSLAGIRALHGLIPDGVATGRTFTLADIAITACLLAGGSEGVHRLANVYTSFADNASSQLDAKNPDKS